jgi:hypothetical protein
LFCINQFTYQPKLIEKYDQFIYTLGTFINVPLVEPASSFLPLLLPHPHICPSPHTCRACSKMPSHTVYVMFPMSYMWGPPDRLSKWGITFPIPDLGSLPDSRWSHAFGRLLPPYPSCRELPSPRRPSRRAPIFAPSAKPPAAATHSPPYRPNGKRRLVASWVASAPVTLAATALESRPAASTGS